MSTDTNYHAKKRAFLTAFAESGTVRGASSASKVSTASHYAWLRNDEIYVESFVEAKRRACEMLEDEAKRRAVDGVRRLKFDKNGVPLVDPATGEPYIEHAYSDVLLIFLMKGNMPEKYADWQRISSEVNISHSADVKALAERMRKEPGYVAYLQRKACESDTDPGAVCQAALRTDQRVLENGSAIP